jgi:hypothetical protein
VLLASLLLTRPALADDQAKTAGGAKAVPTRPGRSAAVAESESFGLVAVVRAAVATDRSPGWWEREDLGPRAPQLAIGTIHDATAAPGLTLSSTGGGGGGRVGPSSHSDIATVGRGHGVDDLESFDHRTSQLTGTHAARPPGAVEGRTPPDVIQRIVRDNFGRFEVCYDAGLRKQPRLSGRVAVKFTIDRRGAVAMASDAGSDLEDDVVVACVVRAFDSLVFPESTDSAVTVVYPVVFTPPVDAP